MSSSDRYAPAVAGYFRQAQQPWYCLLFILLPLVCFHVGLALFGTVLAVPRIFRAVLGYFGAPALHLSGVLIAVTLLTQHIRSDNNWHASPGVLLGMAIESILWVLPLVALTYVIALVEAAIDGGSADGLGSQMLQALGAGIYEEFFFRLVLLSAAMLLFVDVFGLPKRPVAIGAVVVGAGVFALCHFSWDEITGHATFDGSLFVFLLLAGLLWGVVFVFRGLGVVVGSHILYDLYVVLLKLWVDSNGAPAG